MTMVIQEAIIYFLFLCTNITQFIIYCNATMKRRRSLKALIIYSLAKTIIVNIVFRVFFADAISSNFIVRNIYSGLVVFTAILTYIVLLYTFNEHFAKIAIIGTCGDTLASLVGYLARFVTNLMVGKASFDVGAPLYPTDFLLPFIAAVFSYLLLKLIKRFAPKIKAWDIKYKKITMTIFMLYIAYTIYSMHNVVGKFAFWSGLFTAILFSYILVSYVNHYHRTMLWENEMLKKQQLIAQMQYEGIVLQSEQIEHLQYEIDTQMQTVLQLSENTENKSEQIKNYIVSLKQRAENISVGMFCDDKFLDFVLYTAMQKCKVKGIDADFYLQGYKPDTKDSEKLSNYVQKMLDSNINKAKKKLSLSIATVKGKVIIKSSIDGKEKVIAWN